MLSDLPGDLARQTDGDPKAWVLPIALTYARGYHQRSVGDAEASEGSRDSDPAKVEPIGPHVFLWAGLDQGSLRNHFGDVRDRKIEGKQAILRIYGF